MKVKELIEQLKNAPAEMEIAFSYFSIKGDDDFIMDVDDAGVYPLQIDGQEETEDFFCLNSIEPDLMELGLNHEISMN